MGRILGLALALLALLGQPLSAQETRVGEEGFVSPNAQIHEMYWLEGLWQGTGIGGAPATENWLPPTGTTMVGTFVQQTEEGGIRFSEHMYLMEEAGSLVLKLKHFNADLTGWEDKDGMVTFRLLELEPCAAYFHGLTLRCEGDDGLVVAVRMKSSKPEPQELLFRFSRHRANSSPPTRDADCEDQTNRGYELCFAERGKPIAERHRRYLSAATERHAADPATLAAIKISETAYQAYERAECAAVRTSYGTGSIRGAEAILCANALLAQRTHTIWRNWLTYADNTPPLLPEPDLTR